ncbi:hypothetical protein BDV97DRAFT_172743 [Delphinella strobiligena]|nr:hypothetical protein BDV97DRAFT_172743 [Delphinella strobiligena]
MSSPHDALWSPQSRAMHIRSEHTTDGDELVAGVGIRVGTLILELCALAVLVFCLTRRVQNVRSWRSLSLPSYLIIVIYVESLIYMLASATVLRGFPLDRSEQACDSAIIICIVVYFSTKATIYWFFAEKVRLVRIPMTPRREDRLYLFNVFGVIGGYVALVIVNLVYRVAYIIEQGYCIIGMKRKILIPLEIIDGCVHVFLTLLFLTAVRKLYSYKYRTNSAIRSMALRTFIGCFITLVSTFTNLTLVIAINGERGWLCLTLCLCDVIVSVMVLHWVSSIDRRDSGDESRDSSQLPDAQVSSYRGAHAQEHRLKGLPGPFEVRGPDQRAVLTTECSSELPHTRPKSHIRDSFQDSYGYGMRTLRSSLATTAGRSVRSVSAISFAKANPAQWITNHRPSTSVEPSKSPGIQINTEIRRSSSCELNTAKSNSSGPDQEQVHHFSPKADFANSTTSQGASDRTIRGDGRVWKSWNERPSPRATRDNGRPVSPTTIHLNGETVKDEIDTRRGNEQGFGTQDGVTHFSDPFT